MEEVREGEAFFSNLAKHDFGPQNRSGWTVQPTA